MAVGVAGEVVGIAVLAAQIPTLPDRRFDTEAGSDEGPGMGAGAEAEAAEGADAVAQFGPGAPDGFNRDLPGGRAESHRLDTEQELVAEIMAYNDADAAVQVGRPAAAGEDAGIAAAEAGTEAVIRDRLVVGRQWRQLGQLRHRASQRWRHREAVDGGERQQKSTHGKAPGKSLPELGRSWLLRA